MKLKTDIYVITRVELYFDVSGNNGSFVKLKPFAKRHEFFYRMFIFVCNATAFDFIIMFILGELNVNEVICFYVTNGFTYFPPFDFLDEGWRKT